jgi:hypothetical protein
MSFSHAGIVRENNVIKGATIPAIIEYFLHDINGKNFLEKADILRRRWQFRSFLCSFPSVYGLHAGVDQVEGIVRFAKGGRLEISGWSVDHFGKVFLTEIEICFC